MFRPRCPEVWNFPEGASQQLLMAAAAMEVRASSGHETSQDRGLMKAFQFQKTLAPPGGTLWDKLGGRIVNKVAQIYKCSPFYLTCFILLLGSKNPQKCPFVQLPSRAHEGTSPADSSFGHVGCPLWPRRVAFRSLIWRLVYTKGQIATSQRSESFYHSLY